jgi:hypothetical protein
VQSLPGKVLIDTEGRVIGRVERVEDLDSVLAGRLGGKL